MPWLLFPCCPLREVTSQPYSPIPVASPPPPMAGSMESGRKLHVIPRAKKGAEGKPPGHSSHVLCMAISSDGKYLVRPGWPWGQVGGPVHGGCLWSLSSFLQASGDRSKLILIWEAQSCQHLYTFTGHRDAVSVRSWIYPSGSLAGTC